MSLSAKGNFIINNVEYKPQTLQLQFEGLQASNTGRTDDGNLHIEWVKRRLRKLQIEMPPMSASALSSLLATVQGQEYYITYFDNITNAERTMKVYTNSSSADCYSGVIRNGLWQGVAFNAIEMAGE